MVIDCIEYLKCVKIEINEELLLKNKQRRSRYEKKIIPSHLNKNERKTHSVQ